MIDLTEPVVRTGGRTGSAASAVLHLRKDGTVEMVEASGGVTLKQDTRTITAATLHAAMNERSQMQHAELGGGVALLDTNAERPTHAICEYGEDCVRCRRGIRRARCWTARWL